VTDIDPELEEAIAASIEAHLATRGNAQWQAIRAADEKGEVVVNVWCVQCPAKQPPVGTVRRSSSGLVFDSEAVLGVNMDPEERRDREKVWRARGKRPPFIAAGRSVVLLGEPNGEVPRVHCVHGRVELEVEELIRVAQSRTTRAAARVGVHRHETPTC
jgi:hypothetical protein